MTRHPLALLAAAALIAGCRGPGPEPKPAAPAESEPAPGVEEKPAEAAETDRRSFVMEIVKDEGALDLKDVDRSVSENPGVVDVALLDYNRERWINENWGASFFVTSLGDLGGNPHLFLPINNKSPYRILGGGVATTWMPDRMYVSFQFTPVIDVIEPMNSEIIDTITGLPAGAKTLKSYFKF